MQMPVGGCLYNLVKGAVVSHQLFNSVAFEVRFCVNGGGWGRYGPSWVRPFLSWTF